MDTTDTNEPYPITSKPEIDALAKAEQAAGVVDQQTAASASVLRPSPRLREAADEVKQQAKVVAEQVATKAKDVYGQARTLATQRADEGRDAIVDRPYAAVGLVFLLGVVIGHVMSAGRPEVIYLKDRRP